MFDTAPKAETLLELSQNMNAAYPFAKTFMISAEKGYGVDDLKQWLAAELPVDGDRRHRVVLRVGAVIGVQVQISTEPDPPIGGIGPRHGRLAIARERESDHRREDQPHLAIIANGSAHDAVSSR